MIHRLRAYCHNCQKNVADLKLKDREMTVKPYCPANPSHKVTIATWTEKDRAEDDEEARA